MLVSLHVKNLALIDEAEVEFKNGLTILTGETGAGKSIIIGSINLALGAKADKDYIRTGADYALVELCFSLNESQTKVIQEMELPTEEDNTLLLQRKIMPGRSVCKVNGESISTAQLRELSGCLLDMYGQHEHQSLLKPARHKELLDSYAGAKLEEAKKELLALYGEYKKLEKELSENSLDESERRREADLLSFEVNEMEAASIVPGEDEILEKSFRRMLNARRMKETVYLVNALTGYEGEGCAGAAIGRAVRELKGIESLDEEAASLTEQLTEIDNLLNDFNRSMAAYREGLEFDEEEFIQTENRLNILNHLKGKYGGTLPQVMGALEEKQKRLSTLFHYEEYLSKLQAQEREKKEMLLSQCRKVSAIRKGAATGLAKKLKDAMLDLNFIDVDFSVEVLENEEKISSEGYDEVVFMISTNPGEKKRPLWQVASGGELSRIMLAFKTVLADEDGTDTLVFDEIDTGISGRTAWKVAEKLGQLSGGHQILCITHLPQIAAMADSHYLIEKKRKQNRTVTEITELTEQESLCELARLSGSGNVTDTVLSNAKEMRELAKKQKNN